MNPVRKRPAYLFAKDFQIENVLGNLQGYKIASGQLERSDIDQVTQRHGTDEGILFGSLITKAGEINKGKDRVVGYEPGTKSSKRKRKKRKKMKGNDNGKQISTIGVCAVTEPLSIPASIIEYGSSGDELETKSDQSDQQDQESEDSTSDDSCPDFFGLAASKEVKPSISCETNAGITVNQSTSPENDTLRYFESCSHSYPEVRTDIDEWDEEKMKYKDNINSLSTYKCWKCKRIGHLAEDCTIQGPLSNNSTAHHGITSNKLRDYFKRCHVFRNSKDAKCSECSARSNLVSCLDCGLIFCDGLGHLTDHLVSNPSHNKLYSFKLRRLIKCCKPTCDVVDASKLLMCSTCLSKQFNSHYNMINATWSRSGLKGIPNTLACEQHFQWHRINCTNAMEEPLLCQEKLENAKQQNDGLLSEFYF